MLYLVAYKCWQDVGYRGLEGTKIDSAMITTIDEHLDLRFFEELRETIRKSEWENNYAHMYQVGTSDQYPFFHLNILAITRIESIQQGDNK